MGVKKEAQRRGHLCEEVEREKGTHQVEAQVSKAARLLARGEFVLLESRFSRVTKVPPKVCNTCAAIHHATRAAKVSLPTRAHELSFGRYF